MAETAALLAPRVASSEVRSHRYSDPRTATTTCRGWV
jgi:hypothetical protein